ncbi:MAG TPA: hypothetical protein VK034_13120 [Enhygromyxa sp.]|nr:hypothetical protein [Enhygromyxa sp.]
MTARAALLGIMLALLGCPRASEEQRARAALEGRNLRGSSPHSQADRIPELDAEQVGPQTGYLDGAFAYASFEARVVRTLWESQPTPSEWGALALWLDGVDPSARISVSARRLGSGVHVRLFVPGGDPEWFERATASGVSVRAEGAGHVVDWFELPDHEPHRQALIDASIAMPGVEARAELERLQGDAVVLIDGPRASEAIGADPRLRDAERLFAGMTVELTVAVDRLLARARWLPTDAGRERLPAMFELDPVDADVPTVAALCEGALICGRSRGLPARDRFAALATGRYADRDAILDMLDRPEAALVLLLETWPNAIAGLLQPPAGDVVLQNAAELGARVLGFGFAIRSERALDEHWIGYARMSGADLDSIRLLVEMTGHQPPIGRFHGLFDPGNAWGFAVVTDDEQQLAWLAGLPHDDGAVPLLYLEIPDLTQLVEIKPELLGFSDHGNPPAGGVRAQLMLAADRSPELHLALGVFD